MQSFITIGAVGADLLRSLLIYSRSRYSVRNVINLLSLSGRVTYLQEGLLVGPNAFEGKLYNGTWLKLISSTA